MEIKLIVSGSRPWELWCKHWGLSFLIDGTILFDTFANYSSLAKGAKRANIDLSRIQTVVISHDHWDHVDGLWQLIRNREGIDVYFPTHAAEEVKTNTTSAGSRVIDELKTKAIKANIFVTEEMMGNFDGEMLAEQSIVVKTDKGLSVIVGCSHPGIVSMIKKIKKDFNSPIYAVVGGLHLMDSSIQEIVKCANDLKSEGVSLVAPIHCTGWRAERVFKKIFHENYVPLRDGQTLVI